MPSNGRAGFSHDDRTKGVLRSPDGKGMSGVTYKGHSVVYHKDDHGWNVSVILPNGTGTQWVWGRTSVAAENNFADQNAGYDWVRTRP